MRLGNRMAKLEQQAQHRPRANQYDMITAVPVLRAEGRQPGLYRSGPEGSSVGLLVFDPEKGEPVVPEGKLAPWGLFLICQHTYIEPPRVPCTEQMDDECD
jgi:hypothetical protein